VKRLRELLQFVHDSLEIAGEEFAEEFLTRWKKGKIEFIFDDLHQIIDESRDGVQRVKTIVQDLKTFSRSSGAEMACQDLVPGLERALNIAHNEVKYKAEVVREFDEAPAVRCNMQKLEQVFVNLLVNAAQAIDEPMGTITVRLRDLANGHVELQVADTGRGMPQEVRKKIFDPFYTTKDVGQGTGLGLSISYRIIRDHGGTINVDSEPGRGTTFSIMLPVDGPGTEPKGN
jgi:two-component system NtrC family sensor kinase